MADSLFNTVYNPDVLSCLANLSNDEVFTPPDVVNMMLDMLPQDLFLNPDTTFLDPACKTGVFLREIAKRLITGLEPQIPDLQDRIDHIFHKQLYAIAITEMTSLLSRRGVYCSKYPQSEFSVTHFDDAEGNIRYRNTNHSWEKGRCQFCGISVNTILGGGERGQTLESHAYEWIHTLKPEEIFSMKFDVIISNPPYQLNDGGGTGMSAKPIYHLFIDKAKSLKPRYITMIIPSRWFSGGKGLDMFRHEMLRDRRIRRLVDYDNFKDVFPGVDLAGGACYFLWDRDNAGICRVSSYNGKSVTSADRYLDEYDTFIRQNQAIEIVKKVGLYNPGGRYLNDVVSSRLPFGITTTYEPLDSGVPCYFTQRIGLRYVRRDDISDSFGLLDKWKLLVPKAPIAGQTDFSKPVAFYYNGNTRIAKPGSCCSESWLVAGAFDTENEVLNYRSYIFTKIVRFLLLQTVVSQNMTKKNFAFIPDIGRYLEPYTDEKLRKQWDITDEEWTYIVSRIGEIGGNTDAD